MPCYNHVKYVGEAISSVLNQTYTDFEFLIVENASTDNSWDVISGFHDDRIKVWRFEKNDVYKAFDLMVEEARGKYVAQFFSDDYWEPEKLMKQVTALENNPDYLVSATWAEMCDENMNVMEEADNIFKQKGRSRTEWIRRLLEGGSCLSAPSLFARKDMYVRIYKSFGGAVMIPDWYQWLTALKETNIFMIEEVLTKNRMHTANANMSLMQSKKDRIQLTTEYTALTSQVIEDMADEDFVQVYGDMMVDPASHTHLEIICEKFFLFLKKCKVNGNFRESALRYFYRYYTYEENGAYVSDVMKQKYGYTCNDFKKLSSAMGYIHELYKQ
jgi:glycosyltransferase involved in cell wall biosynthesis